MVYPKSHLTFGYVIISFIMYKGKLSKINNSIFISKKPENIYIFTFSSFCKRNNLLAANFLNVVLPEIHLWGRLTQKKWNLENGWCICVHEFKTLNIQHSRYTNLQIFFIIFWRPIHLFLYVCFFNKKNCYACSFGQTN